MPSWQPYGSDVIGAKHLANSAGGFEPQREHNFEILLTPPVGDGQVLLKSVETGFAPSHSSEPLMLPYMNEIVYVAGRPMYAPGTITFRDFVDQVTYSLLESWYKLVYDPYTSIIGFASDYKGAGTLTLMDCKGLRPRQWDIVGIWPQDITPNMPTHMGGDVWRVNVNFQYDKAVPKFV